MHNVRRFIVVALVAGIAGSWGFAAAASAVTTTTTSTTPTSVQISAGFAFTGSVIIGPGLTTPRKLNAYQSAVFVQSWIGDLYFGKPARQSPPPGLPVYEIDVTGNWGGSVQTRASYYASDGKTAWVAFPAQLPVTSTPTAPPRVVQGWFVAPPRVIETFAGRGKLAPTAGLQTPPTATTTTAAPSTTVGTAAPASAPAHHSSRSVLLWIAIVLLAGVVLSVGASSLRGRRARAQ